MVLKHMWGLFSHPDQEWSAIRDEKCSIGMCYVSHVLILALIPAVCGFIGTTQVGWRIGGGEVVKLTVDSALQISVLFYLAMLAAVGFMGKVIHWMAKNFGAEPDLSKCVVMAAYTATPLFLVGLMGLYPTMWLVMLVGLVAVGYTVYLLYTGIPIVMNIPKEQGFIFASAVLTAGLVLLVATLAVSVVLWSLGVSPAYTS